MSGPQLPANSVNDRPEQSLVGLWNLSFGFFGIQIGFALQNANVSRIFQSLGTPIETLPILWIAAPLTGLMVQPLIGHMSDRTWGRLGRRRPYFLAGALLSTLALIAMPNAAGLLVAAMLLWLLDASLNISMEPFRAFVGDMLPPRQRPAGYAFQTGFIGAGAVAASLAPWLLNDLLGVPNTAPAGTVPPSVRYAFYLGAAALLVAVLWTVLTTREYPPEPAEAATEAPSERGTISDTGLYWIAAGAAWAVLVYALDLERQLYLPAGLLAAFGAAKLFAARQVRSGRAGNALTEIIADFEQMPPTMVRLAVVQFFTWSALFMMWIFTTPIVAQNMFGASDPASKGFNEGADWVGVLFAIYNGVALAWAFVIPKLTRRIGKAMAHVLGLSTGALGYLSFLVIHDPVVLIGAMVLIGIAWSSILTLPYAILCDALPQRKLGIYMGLFNIFIVLPQITVAVSLGSVVKTLFPANPLPVMGLAGATMAIAAATMLTLRKDARVAPVLDPTTAPLGT